MLIEDPTDDVRSTAADGVSPVEPLGIDIVGGAFSIDKEGLSVAIRVDDMESIDNGSPWVGATTEYRAAWDQDGFRDGTWRLRVHYNGAWSNTVEGPCLDGSGGECLDGNDRDGHYDIPMEIDTLNETVRVLVPADLLPAMNVTWSEFAVETSAVQKAYGLFFIDQAFDETDSQIAWPATNGSAHKPRESSPTDDAGKATPFVNISILIGILVVGARKQRHAFYGA